jgi:hypothetical protein
MARQFSSAACLLAAITLSACSRDNTPSPQAANQATAAPQADSDSGDDDDGPGEAPASPRISLAPAPDANHAPGGFTPLETTENDAPAVSPIEEEPPAPSLFRSLGRALTRGVADTVTGSGEETPAESPSEETAPPQATPQ